MRASAMQYIYKERWALITCGDIVCSLCWRLHSHHAHAPPLLLSRCPCPSLTTPWPIITCVLFPGHDHWGGTPPLDHGRVAVTSKIGTRQRRLCLSFVLAATCTMLRQDLTPGLAPTQHNTLVCNHTSLPPPSVLPPPHTPTPSNTSFFANMLALDYAFASSWRVCITWVYFTSTKSTPLTPANTQPPQALDKYKKELWLYQSFNLHNLGTAQVGISLVSLFDSLFKRSRLHCLDVCLTR